MEWHLSNLHPELTCLLVSGGRDTGRHFSFTSSGWDKCWKQEKKGGEGKNERSGHFEEERKGGNEAAATAQHKYVLQVGLGEEGGPLFHGPINVGLQLLVAPATTPQLMLHTLSESPARPDCFFGGDPESMDAGKREGGDWRIFSPPLLLVWGGWEGPPGK